MYLHLDMRGSPRTPRGDGLPGPKAAKSRPARRAPAGSRSRPIAAGVLGGIAISLLLYQLQYRDLEAYVAAHLFGIVTPTLAATGAPIIWFGLPGANSFGLVITPDCSSSLLLVPLCGLGMLLMIPRKLRVGRTVKALSVAAILLVSGNMLRIAVIAVTTRLGGIGAGYQFGHLVLGSFISIVCIAISLTLLTVIITRQDA